MKGKEIASIYARQVLSDRGNLAVEATVVTKDGHKGTAVCTAGLSVGSHEIAFSYDDDARWLGQGVKSAVRCIEDVIAPRLKGMDVTRQHDVDYAMLELASDPSLLIGGNATAAVSAAALKAGAAVQEIPLYRHIGGEEATVLPLASFGCYYGSARYDKLSRGGGKPTCSFIAYDFASFSEASEALGRVYHEWKEALWKRIGLRQTGMPESAVCSGFFNIPAGYFSCDMEIWDLASEIIEGCGYGGRIGLQIDIAADSFFDQKTGLYTGLFSPKQLTKEELIDFYQHMVDDYPFVCLEDPLNEDDYEGTAIITRKLGIQIVGDDLFTTTKERVEEGVRTGAANCVLLKVNQVGTISKALEMVQYAYENGYGVMPCLSRGENAAIADYSVGINSSTIREAAFGVAGTRLREIERELGDRAVYLGRKALKGSRFQEDV